MQAWAESASSASPPPPCPKCGSSMRHRGLARRTPLAVHGTIQYARPRRRCDRCGHESYPQHATLCFGSHGVSWKAAQRVSRLASLLPSFQMTRELLLDDYGIELSKHTIERIVNEAGSMLLEGDDAQRAACFAVGANGVVRGPKESPISPEITAVYADGTMIHTEDEWREIRVGRVIAQDAQGRRVRQCTFARLRAIGGVRPPVVRSGGARRATARRARRAFVGDGAHWLWELAALHFPAPAPILDWYHLSENVHAAADAVARRRNGGVEAVG